MKKFNIKNLTPIQKKLRKRILELSFEANLSHIGSCLTAIDAIYAIYKTKRRQDLFILSNGHAGVAYYTVLEHFGHIKDKAFTKTLHVHPDRNPKIDIHVSSGSLGQGFPIAVGMALANRKKNIYCMISDGEATEGSIWEALRVAVEQKLQNITLLINYNGWGAYSKIQEKSLLNKFKGFGTTVNQISGHNLTLLIKALKKKTKGPKIIFMNTVSDQFSFLKDLDAHYYTMTNEDYQKGLMQLS